MTEKINADITLENSAYEGSSNELLYTLLLCSAKLSMGPLPHLLAWENGLGLCHKPRQKTFKEI